MLERPDTTLLAASTLTFPALSPAELIVVPPALTLPVAVTLSTSSVESNFTLIVLLVLSAVTLILSSPAKFNVGTTLFPSSSFVGFTSILVSPAVAFQPASTF